MDQNEKKPIKGVSNIYSGITTAFKFLGQRLAWIPGNGESIWVGMDPIVGGSEGFVLSHELVNIFH